MSYCRFQNTYQDLLDCSRHLYDDDLSEEEERARKRLIQICQNIINQKPNDEEEE